MSLARKLRRRAGQMHHNLRRALGLLPDRTGRAKGVGVYVAYYDASRIYATHLESFRRNTVGPFNYYVMKNCSTEAESRSFDRIVGRYGFPRVFGSWPPLEPLSHGESMQRMIEMTRDEIIVLCDVDAFPLRKGWDEFVRRELETKDVVAVLAHFPHRRELPVFLHPCFMALRRDFLERHRLDVLPDGENDPAFRVTTHLMNSGRFDIAHVTPLTPTRREVDIPSSRPDVTCLGRTDLLLGFGTTYDDLVFHFWFARNIRSLAEVYNDDGELVLTSSQMREVVDRINRLHGPGDDAAAA